MKSAAGGRRLSENKTDSVKRSLFAVAKKLRSALVLRARKLSGTRAKPFESRRRAPRALLHCANEKRPEGRRSFAQVTGLEPAASPVTGECSNQLSYTCIVSGYP